MDIIVNRVHLTYVNPFSQPTVAVYATRPNNVVQWDVGLMGPSNAQSTKARLVGDPISMATNPTWISMKIARNRQVFNYLFFSSRRERCIADFPCPWTQRHYGEFYRENPTVIGSTMFKLKRVQIFFSAPMGFVCKLNGLYRESRRLLEK